MNVGFLPVNNTNWGHRTLISCDNDRVADKKTLNLFLILELETCLTAGFVILLTQRSTVLLLVLSVRVCMYVSPQVWPCTQNLQRDLGPYFEYLDVGQVIGTWTLIISLIFPYFGGELSVDWAQLSLLTPVRCITYLTWFHESSKRGHAGLWALRAKCDSTGTVYASIGSGFYLTNSRAHSPPESVDLCLTWQWFCGNTKCFGKYSHQSLPRSARIF